jgi:peroxiredoxin
VRGLGLRASGLAGLLLALFSAAIVPASAQTVVRTTYDAQLHLAGGPLHFTLITAARGERHTARVCNGGDCAAAQWTREGDTLLITIPDYDAVITAEFSGDTLDGTYYNVGRLGPRTIPFSATRQRRAPRPRLLEDRYARLIGSWDATFVTDGRTSPRVFRISRVPEGLEGAVLSNTGDYGRFTAELMGDSVRFSHFDGSFVYMFTARLDGDTLRGTFHAGLRTQTPFTAIRTTGARHLTPPDEMTRADTAPFRFAFRDLDGRMVTQDDPRFRGKVVIVDLFGTWCPTCHDAATSLRGLYRKYHGRGLEVVGIAYEVSGDTATDARMVRTFRDKLGLPWPLLLAGTPTAETQNATQPQLQNFVAYPTTLFLGRDGRIRRIHAGFYGPATGEAHTALLASFEQEVERLLAED